MDFPHGETVTRLRGTSVADPYNPDNTEISWDDPDELEIPGCGFNPGQSSEPVQDARNAVITQPEVYAPAGSDVLAGDRLVVRGDTYDVEGNPADWKSPFSGWRAGMVVALKRTDG